MIGDFCVCLIAWLLVCFWLVVLVDWRLGCLFLSLTLRLFGGQTEALRDLTVGDSLVGCIGWLFVLFGWLLCVLVVCVCVLCRGRLLCFGLLFCLFCLFLLFVCFVCLAVSQSRAGYLVCWLFGPRLVVCLACFFLFRALAC